ncbi:hypothetical protein Nepgr_007269 [Nepenthes gracilis]|uniref:Uncharacterized protein n=1 Tax=Nepenthes gracilis TaxID=150966 RepID=A0AAD3XI78_NEPGR|nr:hypothetical protein Nepgr_007269 [Nepenthes gracilis]
MASTLVLAVVFVLDVIAFALAIAAEQRRSSAKLAIDKSNMNYCVYSSDRATGLGMGSFLFLLASQLLIMVASRCLCCGRGLRYGISRTWAIVLFIICWVTFIIAEVCLLAGSARNAYHTKYRTLISSNPPSCQTLRKGVFGAGAAFIVFTGIISELYYVNYSKASISSMSPYDGDTGVRMGNI